MKPKISIFVLCSTERTGWINPLLCLSLLNLQRDPRFDITIRMVMDKTPVEHARNLAIVRARAAGAAMCIQIDNDQTLPSSFADILHDAYSTNKAVVGLGYGTLPPEGPQIIPADNGPADGHFRQTGSAGAGVLIISSEVWRTIQRGPWFRWLTNDDETLSRKLSEDYYFCGLVQQHGMKVWTHLCSAGHLKTDDATRWILHAARLEAHIANLEGRPNDAPMVPDFV